MIRDEKRFLSAAVGKGQRSQRKRCYGLFSFLLYVLIGLGVLHSEGVAYGQKQPTPPAPSAEETTVPPRDEWPWGRWFPTDPPRPASVAVSACSYRYPLCAHSSRGNDEAQVLSVLNEMEEAYNVLRWRIGLPAPVPDDLMGGSDSFDLYLTEGAGEWYRLGFEVPYALPNDRAATFGLLNPKLSDGCWRRTAIYRLVFSAAFAAIDAAETGGFFASSASYLASAVTGCTLPLLQGVAQAQREPERALLPVVPPDAPDASPLLPWYLDEAFGAGPPGTFLAALWHLGTQRTLPEAARFHNQPDLFATLAALAKGKKKNLADVLIDAAVARAFLGDREDGAHLPETKVFGSFGHVRFDAVYPYGSLPRRLAFTPLDPTGAVYLWIDLQGAPADARLALQADWEQPVTIRWAAVRIDKQGREVSRVDVTWEPHVYHMERQVLALDSLVGVLLVGINVGEVAPGHPFRSDEAPYEPHGGTLFVAAE
jgi:hypothetical protein